MKMDIEWHNQCFKNNMRHVSSLKAEISRMQKEVDRQDDLLEHYAGQIDTATTRKMDGFDRERFMKRDL